MTQADFDNGQLICLVGFTLAKPAEFVIFRIGQKTVEPESTLGFAMTRALALRRDCRGSV